MTNDARVRALAESVRPVDAAWHERAWERLDSLTKPPRSLGRLEELAAKVATAQRDVRPDVSRKRMILMAADHGVTAQGVSPYPREVTAQMVANFASGGAAISQLAPWARSELLLVDMGVDADLPPLDNLVSVKLARGTADMTQGPAMPLEQAAAAVLAGARIAEEAIEDEVTLVGTGEMGIGNSTAAAALAAVMCGCSPAEVVGPGTGLDAAGVARKAEVVARAIEVNAASAERPLETLAAVGGLEIAGLTGVMLGAAARGVCVVADGYITGAAALVALRMAPAARDFLFASHRSAEPGHEALLAHLALAPYLDLSMRLGEGTGAALFVHLARAASAVYHEMATFKSAGVDGAL
jgi:nicotinate-nucleotide--dimethylbenzimidazole phosphoribosyltransferase